MTALPKKRPRPAPLRVFETVLYADDLRAMEHFYGELLGLEVITRSDLLLSFRCEGSVLLVFDRAKSSETGRDVPSHGATGAGHIAFGLRPEDFEPWLKRLEAAGVAVEKVVDWEQGGRSIYVRDPAGNSVEFAPSTLWSGDWPF